MYQFAIRYDASASDHNVINCTTPSKMFRPCEGVVYYDSDGSMFRGPTGQLVSKGNNGQIDEKEADENVVVLVLEKPHYTCAEVLSVCREMVTDGKKLDIRGDMRRIAAHTWFNCVFDGNIVRIPRVVSSGKDIDISELQKKDDLYVSDGRRANIYHCVSFEITETEIIMTLDRDSFNPESSIVSVTVAPNVTIEGNPADLMNSIAAKFAK